MTERSVNPYRELFADMTPTEFERYCMETLKVYAEKDNLSDFTILHNQKLSAEDGTYQIDILCRFTVAGMTFKILVECKKYKHPVERKVVAELYTKPWRTKRSGHNNVWFPVGRCAICGKTRNRTGTDDEFIYTIYSELSL